MFAILRCQRAGFFEGTGRSYTGKTLYRLVANQHLKISFFDSRPLAEEGLYSPMAVGFESAAGIGL